MENPGLAEKKKKEMGFIVKGVAKRFCKLTHKSVHFYFH